MTSFSNAVSPELLPQHQLLGAGPGYASVRPLTHIDGVARVSQDTTSRQPSHSYVRSSAKPPTRGRERTNAMSRPQFRQSGAASVGAVSECVAMPERLDRKSARNIGKNQTLASGRLRILLSPRALHGEWVPNVQPCSPQSMDPDIAPELGVQSGAVLFSWLICPRGQ